MKLTYQKRTGHERTRFAKKNSNSATVARRKRVKERLELQLKKGYKPVKKVNNLTDFEPLTDIDRKRINSEIEVLMKRI